MVNPQGRRYGAALLVTSLVMGISTAPARAQYGDGWYAGIAAGNSNIEVYRGGWFGFGFWEEGPSEASSLVFGGYRLNEHLAFDVSYLRAGDLVWYEQDAIVTGLPGIYDTTTVMDTSAFQLSALGILPFARIWEVYLRGGASWYSAAAMQEVVDYYDGQEFHRSFEADDRGFLLGLGVGVTFSERWHVWLEYQYFDIQPELINVDQRDSATVDTMILGVDYRFGP